MSELLETTKRLKKGTLESSGVKYYLCDNENPNESIVLTLIVHVGSLMEEEDEQGLAHFIEHLGFKSTKSFEHYELVKFLESLGISYGPDLNASTHLLETIFRLNVQYDEDFSQVSTGINVLGEWAYHLSITETDVREERQVIAAEYMAKQGLGNRLLKQYWKAIFDDSDSSQGSSPASSLLSKRFPIGIPEVFMHCENHHIRNFYQKWYRPENMSVLVCGALHGQEQHILSLMEVAFTPPPLSEGVQSVILPPAKSSVTRCQELQEQFLVLPTHHTAEDVVVAMEDADLTATQICFEFFSPVHKSRTKDFIRQEIIRRVMSSILDKRFNELHRNTGRVPVDVIALRTRAGHSSPPFLSVQISIREFVRGLVCIGVSATLKDATSDVGGGETCQDSYASTIEVAMDSLLMEMKRLRTLGVNLIEFNQAKGKWLTFFHHQRQKKHIDNAYMVSEVQNFVLNGENVPLATPSDEAEMCIAVIESLTIEEINSFLTSTFDMDVAEGESAYYQAGNACCFRAVSGQFPALNEGCKGDKSGWLRSVLAAARERVNVTYSLDEWPCHDQIDDARVLEFAQQALEGAAAVSSRGDFDAVAVTDTEIGTLQCSEFILSNGITVCCKWMPDASQGKVSMQGFALGGSSELTPLQDLLMSGLDEIAGNSNCLLKLGAFSGGSEGKDIVLEGKDISELQSVAHTRVNTQRHQHHRGVGGSATVDRVELLLAFLVIKMTSQCIDRAAFDEWISKKKSQLSNQSNSPEFTFMNRSRILTCGDEPNFRPITMALLQEAADSGYEVACDLYNRAFVVDPTEYTFVFTGDIGDKQLFKALLVKYLGRLKPNEGIAESIGKWLSAVPLAIAPSVKEVPPPASAMYPYTLYAASQFEVNGPVEDTMHLLKEDNKSSMMLIFRADMISCFIADDDVMFSAALDAACRVLQMHLLDELRIKMGKVYNVAVEKSRNSLCTFFLVTVGLYCHPSDADVITESLKNVLGSLQSIGPDADKLNAVFEAMCKTQNEAVNNSSHWLFWILDSYKAHKVHEWRCTAYPDAFKREQSSEWLKRNVHLRATGKLPALRKSVTCASLRLMYQSVFDLKKSVLMQLCPKHTDLRGGVDKHESHAGESTCAAVALAETIENVS